MNHWVFAALLVGCACEKVASPAKPATELRVPLPEGWVATGSNERLTAGPKGRVVASYEPKAEPMPSLDVLIASVEAQKVAGIQRVEAAEFVGVRYTLEAHEAFVGVKAVGAKTVWCASLKGASESEVTAGLAVCRDLGLVNR